MKEFTKTTKEKLGLIQLLLSADGGKRDATTAYSLQMCGIWGMGRLCKHVKLYM